MLRKHQQENNCLQIDTSRGQRENQWTDAMCQTSSSLQTLFCIFTQGAFCYCVCERKKQWRSLHVCMVYSVGSQGWRDCLDQVWQDWPRREKQTNTNTNTHSQHTVPLIQNIILVDKSVSRKVVLFFQLIFISAQLSVPLPRYMSFWQVSWWCSKSLFSSNWQ